VCTTITTIKTIVLVITAEVVVPVTICLLYTMHQPQDPLLMEVAVLLMTVGGGNIKRHRRVV
jgi:hypothetical protein